MALDSRYRCERCRHYHGLAPALDSPVGEPNPVPCCDAFPGGIPGPLLSGYYGHETPYPGDCGIRFEPALAPPRRA